MVNITGEVVLSGTDYIEFKTAFLFWITGLHFWGDEENFKNVSPY